MPVSACLCVCLPLVGNKSNQIKTGKYTFIGEPPSPFKGLLHHGETYGSRVSRYKILKYPLNIVILKCRLYDNRMPECD